MKENTEELKTRLSVYEDSPKVYLYIHYTDDWTKPFYVGKGVKGRATSTAGRNTYWHNIVKKHGSFNVKIIMTTNSQNNIKIAEKALIAFFGFRKDGGYLCNLTMGGDGCLGRKGAAHPMYGKKHSEETKQKLSKAGKGKQTGELNPMYNKRGELNPMFGKQHTEETKQKIRDKQIGKYNGAKNPFYGKNHSVETIAKMSKNRLGASMTENTKQAISKSLKLKRLLNPEIWDNCKNPLNSSRAKMILDTNTGVFYYGATDAEKYHNLHRRKISNMLYGKIHNITSLIFA